jgi:hypothetical protein
MIAMREDIREEKRLAEEARLIALDELNHPFRTIFRAVKALFAA